MKSRQGTYWAISNALGTICRLEGFGGKMLQKKQGR